MAAQRRILFMEDLLNYPCHPGTGPQVRVMVQVLDPVSGKAVPALARVSDLLQLLVTAGSVPPGEDFYLVDPSGASEILRPVVGEGAAGGSGLLTPTGGTSTSAGGEGGSGGAGNVGGSGQQTANQFLTGQGVTGDEGSLSPSGGTSQNASIGITGQGGSGGSGTETASGQKSASAPLTGQGSSGGSGTETASGQRNTTVPLTGQGGSGGSGTETASAPQSGLATLSGQGGTGDAGILNAPVVITENFASNTFDPALWDVFVTAGTNSITSSAATGRATVYHNYAGHAKLTLKRVMDLDQARAKVFDAKMKLTSLTGTQSVMLHLTSTNSGMAGYQAIDGSSLDTGFLIQTGGNLNNQLEVIHIDNTGTPKWLTSAGTWSASGSVVNMPYNFNVDDYLYRLETNEANQMRVTVLRSDETTVVVQSDWITTRIRNSGTANEIPTYFGLGAHSTSSVEYKSIEYFKRY